MNNRRATFLSIAMAVIAAGLFVSALKFPIWQMRMESPQYRDEEAIRVAVFPGGLTGDIKEVETLNQYIGVRIPRELPQCGWLPTALILAALLGLFAASLPRIIRKWGLIAIPTVLATSLLFAAVQARQQMYDIGHHRNEKTPLRGVKDFTPPFFGKTKLFQFDVESSFGLGAYFIAGAIALQLGGAWVSRKNLKSCNRDEQPISGTVSKTKGALA